MKISKRMIRHIERAIELKLFDHQIDYLLDRGSLLSGRGTGKTVAYCIKLSLSDGDPLDMKRVHEFSDHGDGSRRYADGYFKDEFMKYRSMLENYGFPVRKVRF